MGVLVGQTVDTQAELAGLRQTLVRALVISMIHTGYRQWTAVPDIRLDISVAKIFNS